MEYATVKTIGPSLQGPKTDDRHIFLTPNRRTIDEGSLPESTEFHTDTRSSAIGHCIYCGRVDGLSDEHVVPFGLSGKLILTDASCAVCADITSKFERRVLRGFMLDARTAAGFPTRRPKQRPKTIKLEIGDDEEREAIELPSDESPGILMLPRLAPAAFLAGRPPTGAVSLTGLETIAFGKDPREVAVKLGAPALSKSTQVDATAFVRMLAKIGYAYTVFELGAIPRNQVPVLPAILGVADDGGTWVGSADFKEALEQSGPTHTLALEEVTGTTDGSPETVLVARVKLFANSGASGYKVVVQRGWQSARSRASENG